MTNSPQLDQKSHLSPNSSPHDFTPILDTLPPPLDQLGKQLLTQLDSIETHIKFIQVASQLGYLESIAPVYKSFQKYYPEYREIWDQCKTKLIEAANAQWIISNQIDTQQKQKSFKIWKVILWSFVVLCTSFGVYHLIEAIKFLKQGPATW